MSQFSNAEKAKEVRREALLRERVYPGWVRLGRISADTANHRTAVMQEVADEYEALAQKELLL